MNVRSNRLLLVLAMTIVPLASGEEADPTTFTAVGEPLPDIDLTTVAGGHFTNDSLKGDVVVLNFFATWCGPCRDELPHLENEVWEKYRDEDFELVVVGREHTPAELNAFRQETGFTFPLVADPDRATYGKFAEKSIPRTYVIGRDGTILYQSKGYDPKEFAGMIAAIDQALDGDAETGPKRVEDAEAGKPGAGGDVKSVTISGETRIRVQRRD